MINSEKNRIKTIPENWEEVVFSDVVDINSKRTLTKGSVAKYVAMEYLKPFQKQINNYTLRKFKGGSKFQNNDTLFARITPSLENGKTSFVDILDEEETGFGSTEFIVMSSRKGKILSNYVYYLSRTHHVRNTAINAMTGTSGRQRVDDAVFNHMLIHIPTKIQEQSRISKILSDFDSKIKLLQKQNKILEQIAQAIFKLWFVDFDGQTKFVDSELGKIPKEWKVVNMPELIEINPSRNLKKDSLAPYLGMTDIPIYSSRISRFYLRVFTSGMKFMNGDTLVARITPSLENGKTAFVDFLQNNEVGWGSTEYIVLRPRNPFPPEYGYCFARTDEFRSHAIANMTGTSGRQRVPENCFDDYKVVTPPIDLVETFGKISKKLFLKIKENGEMCDVLATLRDTLLPKLMSGEIRV